MKNKWTHIITCTVIGVMIASVTFPSYVYASDGEDYITISVDAVDDNTDLQYALDSDDPTAFTKSNEFTVPAGTSHTIYVKDAAGNVTSQQYEPQKSTDYYHYDYEQDDKEDTQQINIDLELGRKETEEEYSPDEEGNPGTASVTNRTKTDGSVDAEKVFYTFTTKEGEELYLVVDQGRGSDNVFLLDTVSLGDLRVLADGHESSSSSTSNNDEKEDNLLSILAAEESADDNQEEIETLKKESSSGNPLLVILIVGIVGGAYYYLKIYRVKKDEKMDEMDAMDMDEFEAKVDEEEEIDFDYDEEEKQRFLNELLESEGDSDLLDVDPDEFSESHIEDGAEAEDAFGDSEDDLDIF